MEYNKLKEINEALSTIDVKGKDYTAVNQRILGFRQLFPNGTITTEILSNSNGVIVMKATVSDEEGKVLATGHAYEKENSSFINKTSYIENCETSAVGRALGILGLGIDENVASADEVKQAIVNQGDMTCVECKGKIEDYIAEDGKVTKAASIFKGSLDKFGKPLCMNCINKMKEENK